MATTEEFEAAVAKVKTFTKDPGNVKKLRLYASTSRQLSVMSPVRSLVC